MQRKNKILKIILVLALFTLVCVCLLGCNKVEKVKITFVCDGNELSVAEVNADAEVSAPQQPEKSGHRFVGWYDNAEFTGSPVEFPVKASKSQTYYARFTDKVNVTLNYGASSQAPQTYEVKIGSNYAEFLQDKTPQLDGAEFYGWQTGSDYLAQDAVVDATDATLVAKWQVPYTVTCMLQKADGTYEQAAEAYTGKGILGESCTPEPQIEGHILVSHAGETSTLTLGLEGNQYVMYFHRKPVTLTYHANLPDGKYIGNMSSVSVLYGSTVTISPLGFAATEEEFVFAGWAEKANMAPNPLYVEGRTIVLTKDLDLYAVWNALLEFYDKAGSSDVVCIDFSKGSALGSAVLKRQGQPDKNGFFDLDTMQAEFMMDDPADNIYVKLENDKFMYRDQFYGTYLMYDYIDAEVYPYVSIKLDGYGECVFATYTSQGIGGEYGRYSATDKGDFLFEIYDVATHQPTGQQFHFIVEKCKVTVPNQDTSMFSGIFMEQGYESGSFAMYDNGEFYDYELQLNGYGHAKLYSYLNDQRVLEFECQYKGTENFENYFGEWQLVHDNGFKFVLSIYSLGDGTFIPLFIEYDAETAGEYTGDDLTVYLDGYQGAYITYQGINQMGIYTYEDTLLKVTLFNEQEEYTGKMFFTVDWAHNTITKQPDGGYILNGTRLTSYEGDSNIIVVPNDVTEIAASVFSTSKIDVKIVSATIPASVTQIGNYAFRNNMSLQVVYVLGETPATLGESVFNWMSGDFRIIVPEGCGDAYRTAWAEYEKYIFTATEYADQPEFKVEDGVLIKYNCKVENPSNLALTIPDGVTEIDARVFKGLTYIASVDLNDVIIVGTEAFSGCTSLTSVTFTNVQTVGEGAFQSCLALTEISLPQIVSIEEGAFAACGGLRKVIAGEHLASIAVSAFQDVAQDDMYSYEFILVLTGNTAPAIVTNAFAGSWARIQVNSVDLALSEFYPNPQWNEYNRSLLVEAGAEAGTYYNVANMQTAVLRGRMEMEAELFLYKIQGSTITFYMYDKDTATYATLVGSYQTGRFSFTFNGALHVYVEQSTTYTYNGPNDETLVVTYQDATHDTGNLYTYSLPATYCGRSVKLTVANSGIITFDLDGMRYTVLPDSSGNFTYTKKVAPFRLDLTAADGSTLTLNETSVCAGSFKNLDGNEITQSQIYVEKLGNNVYLLTISWRSSRYKVTVNVSGNTFTYTWQIANTSETLRSAANDVLTVYKDASGAIINIHLSFREANNDIVSVNSTYRQTGENTYEFVVNDTYFYDDGYSTVEELPSPYNGTYVVTIDWANKTFTIVKIG